jgi:hypothetical protein
MYFALEYIASPQDQTSFFLGFPRFIKFLDMICLRLFRVYGIKSGITKARHRPGFLDIYILNAHLIEAFISNRPVDNTTRVFRLSISADPRIVRRLLRCVYSRRRFFKNEAP